MKKRILDEDFDRLVTFAADHGGPPKNFLAYRRNQLDLVLALSGIDVQGKQVVEVGGGVSGQSYLLSTLADRVVCTDLLSVESIYGGDFSEAAAIRDITSGRLLFVCGRAEELPLADECADVVFSSYVLEHVAKREAAAREMHRILRPGGHVVVLVPNAMETILRTLWFATVYWPRQVAKLGLIRSGLTRRFGMRFRNPPDLRYHTHGTYTGFRAELAESRIDAWDEIFRKAGFEIVRRYSLSYESYLASLGFFSSILTLILQQSLLRVSQYVGRSRLGVWIGPSYGFVARRHAPTR